MHDDVRIDTQYDGDSNPSKQKFMQTGVNGPNIID